ncbi:hypothetical protein JZM24_17520 [Candidatus Sodalis endolongispinus]|uniref:Uncharacterized protein n=1 Tax=Candidatus Sodalis endolongispinus TaxID=2812662 RepID=A0ABS5YFM6_9GAMM|nr:hypothetical protein [Candidatus Sodalis endolongispinus]MBT9433442.1 hypothetical protein [Candidatus Sodalis endolongispinus]
MQAYGVLFSSHGGLVSIAMGTLGRLPAEIDVTITVITRLEIIKTDRCANARLALDDGVLHRHLVTAVV